MNRLHLAKVTKGIPELWVGTRQRGPEFFFLSLSPPLPKQLETIERFEQQGGTCQAACREPHLEITAEWIGSGTVNADDNLHLQGGAQT